MILLSHSQIFQYKLWFSCWRYYSHRRRQSEHCNIVFFRRELDYIVSQYPNAYHLSVLIAFLKIQTHESKLDPHNRFFDCLFEKSPSMNAYTNPDPVTLLFYIFTDLYNM